MQNGGLGVVAEKVFMKVISKGIRKVVCLGIRLVVRKVHKNEINLKEGTGKPLERYYFLVKSLTR